MKSLYMIVGEAHDEYVVAAMRARCEDIRGDPKIVATLKVLKGIQDEENQ